MHIFPFQLLTAVAIALAMAGFGDQREGVADPVSKPVSLIEIKKPIEMVFGSSGQAQGGHLSAMQSGLSGDNGINLIRMHVDPGQ